MHSHRLPDAEVVRLLLATLRLRAGVDPSLLRGRWAGAADRPGFTALVDFEGCALWLARRLRQIDAERPAALTHLAREIAARNLLVDAETEATLRHAARRGIPCILLKGAARRALAHELFFADARPTFDLDILVPAGAATQLWQDLLRHGYALVHPERAPRPEHHHLPGLTGPAGVAVEIHTTVAVGIPADETWRRVRSTARPIQRFGVETLVPATRELLWDGMMHAVRDGARGWRLHHLLTASSIVAAGADAELHEIRERLTPTPPPSALLIDAWFSAALWLGGIGEGEAPTLLRRALTWRLALARHLPSNPRVLGVCADEASRLEFALPPTRGVTMGLRPLGAVLARSAYRCWRLARAS